MPKLISSPKKCFCSLPLQEALSFSCAKEPLNSLGSPDCNTTQTLKFLLGSLQPSLNAGIITKFNKF